MKMKYFRFLYGEAEQCFMHFGEVRDTLTDEKFTFLYLKGTDGHVDREKSEHTLFLCPEHLNLVVLGSSDAAAKAKLETILKETEIDALVVSPMAHVAEIKGISSNTKIICLALAEGDGSSYTDSYRIIGAGWNFMVKAYSEDSVTMIHNLDRNGTEKNLFEDCVMSVKILDSEKRCKREPAPDLFGCALGCTLHQDYDVCKYQRGITSDPYVTGTVVLSGVKTVEVFEKDLKEHIGEIRFIGLPDGKGYSRQEEGSLQIMASKCKQYFIGSEAGMDDKLIADVCRSGLYHVPVVLRDGQGICCSGMLKYAENGK